MEWSLISFFTSRPSPMEWSLISFFTSRPSPMEWSLIFFLYIKALSNGMVIDFLMFTLRPSPMEWSLIFLCLHQGTLRWNGHWFSYVYIKALSDGMVIDFLRFTARPSPMEWSLFSFLTSRPSLMKWSMFSFLTSRPSPMKWSLIFLCLQQNPLWWNGHCFLSLHQGPLRCNGHWFSYVYIKTLSDGMVIDFLMFTASPSPMEWSLFSFFTSRSSPMEWLLISLCLHQGPLQGNDHWFLCYIKTLSYGMVESFFTFQIMTLFTELVVRPMRIVFLLIFFLLKIRTKLVFLSLPIFYCDNLKMSHFRII